MKILLIAPLHREKKYYSKSRRTSFLLYQGQQSWINALENLGYEVVVFRSNDSELVPDRLSSELQSLIQSFLPKAFTKYMYIKDRLYKFIPSNYIKNKRLVNLADKVMPRIILMSGGINEVFPKTIGELKKMYKCKVFLIEGVNPDYAATRCEKEIIKKRIIDVVVENDKGYAKNWEKLGARRVIVLPVSSVDPELHRRVKLTSQEQEEYRCDVCFVGSLTKDRQEKLVQLRNFNIKIWGDILSTVGLMEGLKTYYYGKAYGEKMVKIFNAAKIVLNFQPESMTHGGNMRTFEIPGCGAFQLADRIDPDFLIPDKEVLLFKSIFELKSKIKYYLQDDRERLKIAEAGFKKVHKEHTYERHFKKLLSKI